MSPVPDDFEQLRRLLALKKHEQPPPGYFHSFSRQVIVRIKAGDAGNEAEASFWSFGNGSLFQRIWETLDARPVLAGAFGVAVCGFFVVGALLSENGIATASATGNEPNRPTSLTREVVSTRVWEQSAKAESSSLVGFVPNYQPPSLFQEIENQQFGPGQTSSQSVISRPVKFSFPQ